VISRQPNSHASLTTQKFPFRGALVPHTNRFASVLTRIFVLARWTRCGLTLLSLISRLPGLSRSSAIPCVARVSLRALISGLSLRAGLSSRTWISRLSGLSRRSWRSRNRRHRGIFLATHGQQRKQNRAAK